MMHWRGFLSVVWAHVVVTAWAFSPLAYGGNPDQVFDVDTLRGALPQGADEEKQTIHKAFNALLNEIEAIMNEQPKHEKRCQEIQAFACEVSANYQQGAEEREEQLKKALAADDNSLSPALSDADVVKEGEEIDKMQKPVDDLGAIVHHMDPREESLAIMYQGLRRATNTFVQRHIKGIGILRELYVQLNDTSTFKSSDTFANYLITLSYGMDNYLVGQAGSIEDSALHSAFQDPASQEPVPGLLSQEDPSQRVLAHDPAQGGEPESYPEEDEGGAPY
ncbi:hypothetical protein EIL50_03930 [bacterium NHP-B]|nr:hypothetical protein EIL50_03930 [bacterium NHP-B]